MRIRAIVYHYVDIDGRLLYVGACRSGPQETTAAYARLANHRGHRAPFVPFVARILGEPFEHFEDALAVEWEDQRTLRPIWNWPSAAIMASTNTRDETRRLRKQSKQDAVEYVASLQAIA